MAGRFILFAADGGSALAALKLATLPTLRFKRPTGGLSIPVSLRKHFVGWVETSFSELSPTIVFTVLYGRPPI